jgi:hypothetical protein
MSEIEKKHDKEYKKYENFLNMQNELTKELIDELLAYSLYVKIKSIDDENVYVACYVKRDGSVGNEIFKAKTIKKLEKKFDLFKIGWSLGFKYSDENNGNSLTNKVE